MKKTVQTFLFIGFILFACNRTVFGGCDVSVSPRDVRTGSSEIFHFNVTNNGSDPITYVKVPTNLDGAVVVTGANSADWTLATPGGADVFNSGSIAPGDSHVFDISGDATNNPRSFSWTLGASESDGNAVFNCNEVMINIEDAPVPTTIPEEPTPTSVPAPGISGIAVAAGPSSATVTWKLDQTATTVVYYGTTSEYGYAASTTSDDPERVVLSNLSSSTTYHYEIQASGAGGTTVVTDNAFTTAAVGSTTSTTSTATSTTTTVNTTSTITKTVVLTDTIAPIVQINTKAVKASEKAPKIEGIVTDSGLINAGISKIQYSIDSGKSWLLISEPNGATKANFAFTPELSEDGNYPIKIRALDKSGNSGISSTFLVIIDRLPPRIIHSLWHVGPLLINSNMSGKSELVIGVPTHLVVQGVGGITEMKLTLGTKTFVLKNNRENGFWETTVLITDAGEWDAIIHAVDGGGSIIDKKIGTIVTHSNISILPSKTVTTVWRYDAMTGQFNQWNGAPYSQNNPRGAGLNWFLPPGSYYFSLSAPGYNTAVSNIFTLSESQVVTINAKMEKWNLWSLLGVTSQFRVTPSTSNSESKTNVLVGKQLPWLEKNGWEGKNVVLSIIPSWDPSAASRFVLLSKNANQQTNTPYIIVIPGANTSTVNLIKSRGNYSPTFVADPDGESLQDLQGMHLPLTVRVNQKGIIEEVVILK
ncbi:MAG: hypothetical protein NTV98_04500 [Candidatus Roizmanbacteria bacterium]|nr:hypothetical protein [Candidatus Roizmanbacteria bacterium]